MENNNNNCCCQTCPFPSCGCLGYGYVPVQGLECVYDCLETSLKCGTIFPELSLDICEYGKICKKWGGSVND